MSVSIGEVINPTDIEYLMGVANGKASILNAPFRVPTLTAFPVWVPSSSYGSGSFVNYNGYLCQSLTGSNNFIPSNSPYWKTETTASVYYTSSTYHPLDVVGYSGMNFTSTTTQTNNPPVNLTGSTNAGWVQHYLSAFNNLLGGLQTACDTSWPPSSPYTAVPQLTRFQQAISGPWPCGPDIYANDLTFIYPDATVSPVTVTLGGSGPYSAYPTTYVFSERKDRSTTLYGIEKAEVTTATFELIVGGTVPITISGSFYVQATCVQGQIAQLTSSVVGVNTYSNYQLVSDGSNRWALHTVDATNWVPISSGWVQTMITNSGFNISQYTCNINGTVSPGTYKIVSNGNIGGDDSYAFYDAYTNGVVTGGGYLVTYPSRCILVDNDFEDNSLNSDAVTISVSNSTSSLTNGIHNLANIHKIAAPIFDVNPFSFGLFYNSGAPSGSWPPAYWSPLAPEAYYYTIDTGSGGVLSQPSAFTTSFIGGPYPGVSVSANTFGVWTGFIPPIGGLNTAVNFEMPWNLFTPNAVNPPWPVPPYLGGGHSLNTAFAAYSAITEKQTIANYWSPLTYYPQGYVITDTNSNFQQAQISGRTNQLQPSWATAMGATTTESAYVWPRSGLSDPAIIWKMITSPASSGASGSAQFTPAQSRMGSSPSYPVMWANDTRQSASYYAVGQTILDAHGDIRVASSAGTTTTGSGPSFALGSTTAYSDGGVTWQYYMQNCGPNGLSNGLGTYGFSWVGSPLNNTNGGWINEVTVNRIGTMNSGIEYPAGTGVISCNIGCIRSGSFTSFGTFNTGTKTQVLWPIFTNSPLVYQCSERLDIQALFSIGNPTAWGNVGFPIMASSYNDILNILGMIG